VPDVRHHAVQVPATTANLGPGFDAVGAAVTLHLHARTLPGDAYPDRVTTSGEGTTDLPTDDDNLVWRSFVRFCDETGAAVPDVCLRVANAIPLERGLGSSSAAIVAGLGLARAATGTAVGDLELARLASAIEGHPDNVVPAVLGGLTSTVEGDDGVPVVRRVAPHARLRPLVLVPEGRQRTDEARGVLPDALGRDDAAREAARAGHVLAGMGGLWPVAPLAAGDLLHEPARLEVMAATGEVVAELRRKGVHAWLSGAGPSAAAAVAASDADAHGAARSIAEAHGFALHELEWDLRGLHVCPDDGCGLTGTGGCVQCPRQRV
jgi:homoserine kinase